RPAGTRLGAAPRPVDKSNAGHHGQAFARVRPDRRCTTTRPSHSQTFPQGVGCAGREFFWVMPARRSSVSNPLRPPRPPDRRVVKTMPLSVNVEAGGPWRAPGGAENPDTGGARARRGG